MGETKKKARFTSQDGAPGVFYSSVTNRATETEQDIEVRWRTQ